MTLLRRNSLKYKNAIFWGLLSIADIWLFWDGIPFELAREYSVMFALIAAALSSFFFVKFVSSIYIKEETDDTKSNLGYLILFAIVIGIFCIPILFLYNQSNKESSLLNNEAVFTFGRIVDGKVSISGKRGSYVMVNFTTKDGDFLTENYSVTTKLANDLAIDQVIPLIYCSTYHKLFKVLFNDSDIVKYSGKQIRDIKLAELIQLYDIASISSKCDFLNSKLDRWNIEQNNSYSKEIFLNKFRNCAIQIKDKKVITYVHHNNDVYLFENELESLGYKKFETKDEIFYSNNKFVVSFESKREQIDMENIKSLRPMQIFKIVTIIKLEN